MGFTSEDRSNLTAGVYTVIATDAGGCTYSKQITITQPTCGIVISETHTDVLIPNTNTGSIDVTVMGDFSPTSYLWSDGSTSDDRQNIAAGIYTLTGYRCGGCINDITISNFATGMCNIISCIANKCNTSIWFKWKY
jgi:hypothetical protein